MLYQESPKLGLDGLVDALTNVITFLLSRVIFAAFKLPVIFAYPVIFAPVLVNVSVVTPPLIKLMLPLAIGKVILLVPLPIDPVNVPVTLDADSAPDIEIPLPVITTTFELPSALIATLPLL